MLNHKRLDLVVVDKVHHICYIVDVACSFDTRMVKREVEEMDRYNPLEYKIANLWKMKKVKIVPVIIGFLRKLSEDINQEEYKRNYN